MIRFDDHSLLEFLEGSMPEAERARLLNALDQDDELAERLRMAAAGLEAVRGHAAVSSAHRRSHERGNLRRVSPWWIAVAAAASVALAVPSTWWAARTLPTPPQAVFAGQPEAPDPTFLIVLHGRWPDAGVVDVEQTRARAREYWQWTVELAEEGILVAAGDLRWEPGERLGPEGTPVRVAAEELDRPDYLVGMLAVRAGSYEEALAVARGCPHLRYGGSVSVRRVGGGFVTVPGEGDWGR